MIVVHSKAFDCAGKRAGLLVLPENAASSLRFRLVVVSEKNRNNAVKRKKGQMFDGSKYSVNVAARHPSIFSGIISTQTKGNEEKT